MMRQQLNGKFTGHIVGSHMSLGKRRGKSKGKKRGERLFQKGRLSGDEDEALANLCRFLQANPTYVFEPRPVESSFLELYQETGEMNQVLLKQMQRHLIGKPDELRHVVRTNGEWLSLESGSNESS